MFDEGFEGADDLGAFVGRGAELGFRQEGMENAKVCVT